jgi:DNA-binding CsgD family transcriptional regulator
VAAAFGRADELAAIEGFLAALHSRPGVLVLEGEPGIGKTTLWEAGIAGAREQRIRVLSARASGAEAQLSFTALTDLLEEVGEDVFAVLPAPQRRALEVALLRAAPESAPPGPRAIGLGLLNVLRELAAARPLLVAVDDLQWLDPASADALTFAARRLDDQGVSFLLAKRPGDPSELERVLDRRTPEWLPVRPLGLDATRRLLWARLGLTVRRELLRRIVEATRGNPLFALELGRTLVEHGLPAVGEEMPVPGAVEDMLGTRVAGLAPPVRRLLLAVALGGDLRLARLESLADEAAVEDALQAGVLVADGDRLRASHPLLASAARARARARERRELHLQLAGMVDDEELRARHVALATDRPDAGLAATVAEAAAAASARGAARDAVELAEHALRLTPPGEAERPQRLLVLAGYLEVAGERQRVTDLLAPAVDSLPRGAARVHAWLRLAEGGAIRSIFDSEEYLDRALEESGDDAALRAQVLAKKSIHASPACVWRIRDAESWSLEALAAARDDPALERLALHGLAWARSLRGLPIDDVCERFREASDVAVHITDSPEPVAGLRLVWRGQIAPAREILTRFLRLADERNEAVSYALQRLNLCDLELRAGEWDAAARLLDEWAESADRGLLIRATYERCRALLACGRGLPDEAERWVAPALPAAEAGGYRWQVLESLRARGTAALLTREPARAVESLRVVWSHMEHEGVDEPGVFPVVPELVEALSELGELDEARTVVDRLSRLAGEQEHPWGLATASRCAGVVALAAGAAYDEAASSLTAAADAYGELGLRLERARSLLSLGRGQRRLRKWAAARSALGEAAALFDELGSGGWAEQARSELSRIGARKPSAAGALTPSEQRVVELATEGFSNKEIAQTLVVSVRTVEAHLSSAYAKLGVASRTQLARSLSRRT